MDNIEVNAVERDGLILNDSPRPRKSQSGWSSLLLLSVAATTLGSALPAGYNIGVVNNPEHIIKNFCNETLSYKYNVVLDAAQFDVLWSSIVSIFIVGGVIGSLSGSWLADKYGRKGSIMIANLLGIAAGIAFILSKIVLSVELLLIGRLIVGISSGLTTAVVPMYLTELSPLRLRGATGVMCPLGITIGVLFSQVLGLEIILGTENSWHYLLALYSTLTILSLFAFPFIPESPKYLFVICGKDDKAVHELERIREFSGENLAAEIELLKEERNNQGQQGAWTSKAVLKDKKLMLPLLLVVAVQAGQQLSGVNAVFYYSSQMFMKAGLTVVQAQVGSIGAGIVNLAAAIMAVYTMNRFGRRPLFLISCIGAAASLLFLILSIIFADLSWRFLPIVAVLFYIFLYGVGLGPIPYFIASELFEVGPRPIAMAWGSMANWGGNFLVAMTFPSIDRLIHAYVFIFNIIVIILLAYFVWIFFPETKGIENHVIASLLGDGFHSQIKSGKWKPRP